VGSDRWEAHDTRIKMGGIIGRSFGLKARCSNCLRSTQEQQGNEEMIVGVPKGKENKYKDQQISIQQFRYRCYHGTIRILYPKSIVIHNQLLLWGIWYYPERRVALTTAA